MSRQPLPTPVRLLGPAGILPQAICVAMAVFLPEHRILAGIAGGLYAALILSFLSLIHISEPTRLRRISYAVFCLKKKKK